MSLLARAATAVRRRMAGARPGGLALFDRAWYLARYPDVAAAGVAVPGRDTLLVDEPRPGVRGGAPCAITEYPAGRGEPVTVVAAVLP